MHFNYALSLNSASKSDWICPRQSTDGNLQHTLINSHWLPVTYFSSFSLNPVELVAFLSITTAIVVITITTGLFG